MSDTFRRLDLNLLRVFDAVMAERSLTRAAHKLSLTQPAVSNALRRLRETLGDELVRRSGAGIEPTPRAQALWPVVQAALAQLEGALGTERFDPLAADNSFVLAMADATAAALLPHMVRILGTEAPRVSIRVLPLATRDPRRLLDEETADLAIGYFPAVLADLTARNQTGDAVSYAHHRVYDGEYVCLMRKDHPLTAGELTLDDYCAARHLLVSFSGRPYGFTDEALAAMGRERRIVLTVNQFFTAGRVVANSDLLTVLPLHFFGVTGLEGALVWRPLPLQLPTVHVDALWHTRRANTAAHRWLRDVVARAAKAEHLPLLQPRES
jgi:DNA-binding transcriptional LysR family regulator